MLSTVLFISRNRKLIFCNVKRIILFSDRGSPSSPRPRLLNKTISSQRSSGEDPFWTTEFKHAKYFEDT